MPYKQHGFTLIEMMIVVVIAAILASIAFPSYQEYVRRANRAEGQAFLQDVSARQERYLAQNNAYITAHDTADLQKLGLTNNLSETSKYTLTITAPNDSGGYLLTATPSSFTDSRCGNLTLNARGIKGVGSGTVADCWR
jgi:type IV pilus assembly protein PilE